MGNILDKLLQRARAEAAKQLRAIYLAASRGEAERLARLLISDVFASIRLRADAAKRFRTARSGVHLIFQLLKRYEKSWLRISAPERLREVAMPNEQKETTVASQSQLDAAA